MAIDSTVGGAAANSYVTLAEAVTYMGCRFGTTSFDNLSSADKEKALVQATREIDRHRFHGYRNSMVQALQFPRAYPYSSDEPMVATVATVPITIKHATCEQALAIAQNASTGGTSQRARMQAEGVKSFQVGDLSETYGDSASFGSSLCPDARQLLNRWINRTARIAVAGRDEPYDWSNPL